MEIENSNPDYNPFKVPENYFESLEDRLWDRIVDARRPQRGIVRFLKVGHRKIYPVISAAACFIFVFLSLFMPKALDKDQDVQPVEVAYYFSPGQSDQLFYDLAESECLDVENSSNFISVSTAAAIEYLTYNCDMADLTVYN